MCEKLKKIAEILRGAFANECNASRLLCADCDNYGVDAASLRRHLKLGSRWDSIPASALEEAASSLSFLDRRAFLAFLPAFICGSLYSGEIRNLTAFFFLKVIEELGGDDLGKLISDSQVEALIEALAIIIDENNDEDMSAIAQILKSARRREIGGQAPQSDKPLM